MAGKRPHHLPRMLQKGFASHFTRKGAAYAWWYRRGETPIHLNTINIGAEGEFYSFAKEKTLDDTMTAFEMATESTIADLRAGLPRELTDTKLIVEYIAHLELRTFHLRQSLMNMGNSAVPMLLSFIDDESKFSTWMRRRLKADPKLLGDPISAKAKELGLQAPDPKALAEALGPYMDGLLSQMWPNFSHMLDALRASLPEIMRNASKQGQLKALTKALSPPAKVETYEKLSYRLIATETPLILGDAGLLFEVADKRPYRTITSSDYPLVAVLLPLGPNRLLVGGAIDYEPDLERLPLEIARCSFDYFIASAKTDQNGQFAAEIGTATELMSTEEMTAILNEVMAT
jgi:hypothetical protein